MAKDKTSKVDDINESDSSSMNSPKKNKKQKEKTEAFELTWPADDLKKLITRMEKHVPSNDTQSFRNTLSKLPWDEIQFDNYTSKECHQMWILIQQRLRGYRVLTELIEDAKVWVNNPWMDFHRKNQPHPSMPKKPPPPYMLYFKKIFSKVAQENQHASLPERTRIIGQMYKNLPEKKLLKFKKKHDILKAEYEEKIKEFYELHPDQEKLVNKIKKPKRITAFSVFLEDYITNNPKCLNQSMKNISKEVRQKWIQLSDDDKIVWIEKAKSTAELNFAASSQNMNIIPDILVLSKQEHKILEKARGIKYNLPKKPPGSLYSFYTQKVFKSIKELGQSSKDGLQKAANGWKNLSAEEKAKLKEEYDEVIIKYKNECKYYSQLTDLPTGKKKKKSKKIENEVQDDEVSEKPLDSKETPTENQQLNLKREGDKSIDENDSPSKKKKVNGVNQSQSDFETILQTEPKPPPEDILKYFSKTMKKKMKKKFETQEELTEAWENLEKAERKAIKKEHKALKQQYLADYEEFLNKLPPKILKKYKKYKNITE